MKANKENLAILKKMGFTCDGKGFEDWYSLKNGWGFRLDAHKNIKALTKRLLEYDKKED